MSTSRKILMFGGPALVIVATAIFGLVLWGRDQANASYLVTLAGLVIAILSFLVGWFGWLSPTASGQNSQTPNVRVKGNRSVGHVSGRQVVIGDRNRTTRR